MADEPRQAGNPLQHTIAPETARFSQVLRDAPQMHRVLGAPLHEHCTVFNCEVMRVYRNALNALGHEHPKSDCPKCTPVYAEPDPKVPTP